MGHLLVSRLQQHGEEDGAGALKGPPLEGLKMDILSRMCNLIGKAFSSVFTEG